MIRAASSDDIPELVAMAAAMHAESPVYRSVPFVSEDMAAFLMVRLENDMGRIFIYIKDGAIAGMVGGMLVPFMFNFSEGFAADFGFYVRPEYRGGRILWLLLLEFETWARERGFKRFKLGESTGVASEIVGQLLNKLGYNQSGTVFSKED